MDLVVLIKNSKNSHLRIHFTCFPISMVGTFGYGVVEACDI